GQLAAADLSVLRRAVRSHAESLQRRAAGIDSRAVQADRGPAKSISQEWTFNEDVSDPEILRDSLQKMCERVAQSLQKRQLLAHTVTVKFRWADFTTYTRQKTVEVGFDDIQTLYALAHALWQEHWPRDKKLRLLGVGVGNLEKPMVRQLGFDFFTERP
ncbi:MAG TPA: DNA polymerase IV, partial [Anaerolineae bacterium]|nr:DNA polymerase IV [Anaerolineae bacterium]